MENKYNLNDVVYFVHGVKIVKGVVDEYILHYTQKKVIVKYFIRPYGLKDYVTIEEDKIYLDIELAKECVVNDLKNTYSKENIKVNYNVAKKDMKAKFNKEINSFDKNMKQAVDGIATVSDEYYDKLEALYQEQTNNEKRYEISNCKQQLKENKNV